MNPNHLKAYEVLKEEELQDIHSKGWLLRHKKTGARVMLIENSDENKVFNIAFRTPPKNSTGVAHILEHSVLCGSREFPLKDPFVELADYFGKEGTDEKEMMNLLYVTIKAILNPHIEDRLVRCIYELRTMVIQGVMPQLFQCAGCGRELTEEETGELFFSQDEHGILCADCSRMAMDRKRISAAALYAMRYIAVSPLAKLYTFTVRDDVLRELERHIYRYTELNTDKRFKSLEILEMMR